MEGGTEVEGDHPPAANQLLHSKCRLTRMGFITNIQVKRHSRRAHGDPDVEGGEVCAVVLRQLLGDIPLDQLSCLRTHSPWLQDYVKFT